MDIIFLVENHIDIDSDEGLKIQYIYNFSLDINMDHIVLMNTNSNITQ